MWNLQDDKDLDKLSREAVEGYAVDRSPDSWSKLHSRLDAEMPEQRRRRYLLFFLLFLFIGSGVFWITRINSNDITEEAVTGTPAETNQQALSAQPVTKSSSVNKQPATANRVNDQTIVNQKKDAVDPTLSEQPGAVSNLRTLSPTLQDKSKNSINESLAYPRANRNDQKNKNRLKKNPIDEALTAGVVVQQGSNKVGKPEELVKNDEASSVPNEQQVLPQPSENKTAEDPASKNDKQPEAVKEKATSEPIEKNGIEKANSRWTFSAAYAPDISTVKFTHTQNLGLNIGVFVDYKISKKFSLQSGAIYTKKNYKMNGEDFHPPKGGWFDYINLEDVTGSCYMIDFPLNVRYDAVQKKSSNIFFGAGLSSYLMKKEEYSYYYYYNSVPGDRSKTYEGNEGYVLSILNFSAGYEKKLSNAFSLQVEPFFKQTLKGVGFGEISLNSSGVYFSLRYNPVKSRPQTPPTSK